jgi:hypothetical protein
VSDDREVEGQAERREREARARQDAVAYGALVAGSGGLKREAAEDLGLAARTLRAWEKDGAAARPRGRPRRVLAEEQAAAVREDIAAAGPLGGVSRLQCLHPDVTRRELRRMVVEYRARYIVEHDLATEDLRWQVPGAVWAMDHTKLSAPTDDGKRYGFSVRDLASGYELLWEPVDSPDAASTVRLLVGLFLEHGSPLVLKSDNGSAFIAGETAELLRSWKVAHLLSPPWTPGYNGTIEVAMHWLKARTEHAAWNAGRGEVVRREDFVHARFISNDVSWPRRCGGRRPVDLWQARPSLSAEERRAFGHAVAAEKLRLLGELDDVSDKRARAKARRDAIGRALVAHGFLLVRRRLITLHELPAKAAKIR